jgi:hypothetical protein
MSLCLLMRIAMDKAPFKPTALLVMEHNITGLKYFCKTAVLDRVNRYKGSGTRWTNHLKVHGKDVKVGILGFYVEEERCRNAAKQFSVDNKIVESDEWANLVEETGMMDRNMSGSLNSFYGKKHTPETIALIVAKNTGKSYNKGAYRSPEQREKLSVALKGKPRPDISEKLTGRKLTKEHKINIGRASKGRKYSKEAKEKIRQASIAQWARYRANGNKHISTDEGTQ